MIEEDIFHQALSQPPQQRDAILDAACGDDAELRQRVADLLRAHANPGSFLQSPAVANRPAIAEGCITEAPGTVIGPYKLLEQIGEGGMGVVYMAEQSEPVKRRVALKIIKPGMDTRQVIARFEAERQALAMMDHPNIAKVLDAGATETGRPYFVMELVRGVPMTDYCDDHQLTPKQRLELFVTVCQAVQHAHQKGIIHRDIKPTNVLVMQHDDRPLVQVIDFGIAKAVSERRTDKTLFTSFTQMIGTPLYMSPEQAAMNGVDVDTRSDIYSLGVLLYELLTGTTPFDRIRLQQAAFDEVRRIIREEEPQRPSTRLASLRDTLSSVSALRKTEPGKLSQLVKGDLDWIVMKALEKDRSHRYETANGFAADVLRYLADEPVTACPPSAAYRVKKFVRRNKGPVLATTIVLLTLLGGVVGTTVGLVRAEAGWQAATERAEGERQAKERAQANFALANEVVDTYLGKVAYNAELTRADFNPLRMQLLASALPFFEKIAAETSDDPDIEAGRGRAYLRLAFLRTELGEYEASLQDAEAARVIFARLAADAPLVPAHGRYLATSHSYQSTSLRHLSRIGEAEAAARRALAIQEQLVADFPTEPQYRLELTNSLNDLSVLLEWRGQNEEAEATHRWALTLREQLVADFPEEPMYLHVLAQSHNNLGSLLAAGPAAEAAYRRALEIQEQLVTDVPDEPEYRRDLAKHHMNLGNLLNDETSHRRALTILEKLAADFPTVVEYRLMLAAAHHDRAILLEGLDRSGEAEAAYRLALGIRERLVAEFPAVSAYRRELAYNYHSLGDLLSKLNRGPQAEAAYRAALEIEEQLVADFATAVEYRHELAQTHNNLGNLLKNLGKYDEADTALRRALELREKLAGDFPDVAAYTLDLGASYCNVGHLVRDFGEPEAALDWFQQAIARLEPLLTREPLPASARQFLRNSLWGRASTLDALGRHAEATRDWERALGLDDGSAQDEIRAALAGSRLRGSRKSRDSAGCLAAAAGYESLQQTDAGWLYGAACFRAACAAVILEDPNTPAADAARLAREQGDRAMEWLRKAVAAGLTNVEHLQQDGDLDALREREDFSQLMAELEGKPN